MTRAQAWDEGKVLLAIMVLDLYLLRIATVLLKYNVTHAHMCELVLCGQTQFHAGAL